MKFLICMTLMKNLTKVKKKRNVKEETKEGTNMPLFGEKNVEMDRDFDGYMLAPRMAQRGTIHDPKTSYN